MANENKSMVKSIRIEVPPPKPRSPPSSPSSPAPPPNPRTRCSHSKDCGSVRFLLQNRTNFSRSTLPTHFMSYQNESWLDFPNDVLQQIRLGFLERKPVIQVSINGSEYFFDFMRMLQINIVTAKHRSIAWIDENGKCFFPKKFVSDESEDFAENPEIEIDVRTDGCSSVERKCKEEELVEEKP